MRRIFQSALIALCLTTAPAVMAPAVLAQTAPQPAQQSVEERRQAEFNAAATEAQAAAKVGPVTVPLSGQGSFVLPQGYMFVPQPQAGRLMRAYGNSVGSDFVGLVFPNGEGDWLASLSFVRAGYIKDDDAKNWNADELLENLKTGTEEANAFRLEKGIKPIEVRGWVEKPAYDVATHKLVWSMLVADKGSTEVDQSVNYNTYALGREGYFSLNFITGSEKIEAEKPIARTLLAAIHYDTGKAYTDFNASTDRVAEFGLAALVGGVAAKKLGLFAVAAAFFAKFAKIILLGGAALLAGLAKLFRRSQPAG